jgi:hypothetical protein
MYEFLIAPMHAIYPSHLIRQYYSNVHLKKKGMFVSRYCPNIKVERLIETPQDSYPYSQE